MFGYSNNDPNYEPVNDSVPTWDETTAVKTTKAKLPRNAPVWQREREWLGAEGVAAKEIDAIRRRSGVRGMPSTLAILLSDTAWKGSTVEEVTVAVLAWGPLGYENPKRVFSRPLQGPSRGGTGYVIRHPSGSEMRLLAGAFAQ